MPKKGYKSITVHDRIYNILERIYHNHEEELFFNGIHSMSAMHTAILVEWLGDHTIPNFNTAAHKRGLKKVLEAKK